MFNFSTKTIVNKEYKLNDFLKQINASKDVKDDAKCIKNILFTNVINATTLNCEEEKNFKNIYVIKIILKERKIPKLFISELDKNIAFHTYFILEYENEIFTMMAYKNIHTKVEVLTNYYFHDFNVTEIIDLPTMNSVSDVYKMLLEYETGIEAKKTETPYDFIVRVGKINKVSQLITKYSKLVQNEIQPRKKFDYNEKLRKYKKDLEDLLKVEE